MVILYFIQDFGCVLDPLFIIAPPRSYTSVIGGMLGQHPEAYGLPEVNLSHGDTLGQMWDSILVAMNFGTSGLLRLLAELHEGEQTDDTITRARQWVMQRPHWTGRKVFDHIQTAVGPRMLIDKSPRNTMRPENLQRLLQMYPRASFLHLTRHPQTQGKSTLELLSTYGERDTSPRKREVDPEQTWLRSQQNIINFAQGLAVGQYMRIKGETLLNNPKFYLAQICEWLGLSSDDASIEAMLHPETSPFAMIGPTSAPFGNDPNFLMQPKLDFERLARIKEGSLADDVQWRPGETFSKPVMKLARQFGYR